MRIQHNIPAMAAYRNYSTNVSAVSKNLEKLSSGYKINRAGDDAAGLAISEKMRAQISGLEQAQANAKSGINLVQTAEGALTEVHDMLNRMYTLAEQSANGTYDDTVDRKQLQKELDSLRTEINRISEAANFNGIKLLDGSLGEATSNAITLDANAVVNMTDGININTPVNGEAVKETVSITFNADDGKNILFGENDKLTLNLATTDEDGNVTESTKEFTFKASSPAANNKEFGGADFAEQMTSLKVAIEADSDLKNVYDVEVTTGTDAEGNAITTGIKLTAKTEDVPAVKITGSTVTDMQATVSMTTANGAEGEDGITTKASGGWDKILGSDDGTAKDIQNGDKLTFEFTVSGRKMTVTLEAGKDFQIKDTMAGSTEAIATALGNAYFEDDTTTGIDESLLKVGDYFKFTANKMSDTDVTAIAKGSIFVEALSTTSPDVAGKLHIDYKDNTYTDVDIPYSANDAADDPGDGWVAQASTITFDQNLAAGAKFKLSGTLGDGRTFEVELEALASDASDVGANQFKLGANTGATITSILNALKSDNVTLKVKNPDNTDADVVANKVFSDTASTNPVAKEFQLAADATNKTLTITSQIKGVPGKGAASSISMASVENPEKLASTSDITSGREPTTSENKITFDATKVEQGTTLTIDGKVYEFVNSANNITKEGNVAVEVENLSSGATGEDIANALKDAMSGTVGGDTFTSAAGKTYDLTVDGGTLSIVSQGTGSESQILEVAQGDSKPTTTITFAAETKKVLGVEEEVKPLISAGDSITINGKIYEFVKAGARTKDENAHAVVMPENGFETAADAAEALANKVNEVDSSKIIARADGNNVVFTSKYKNDAETLDAVYSAPEVELPKTAHALRLQIGDTAESFNQMDVVINAVNTKEMKLDDISIATQDGAKAAMQKIKDAINYVSDVRGTLGATQNRLDHTINNLSVMQENIQDAESTIRDVDVAKEMMEYTKNNILVQSAQAMLAQANQLPQGVLQLLG